jgi:hypothetical protein
MMYYGYILRGISALIVLAALCVPIEARAQSWLWAREGGGRGGDTVGGIGIDSQGNSYAVGTYTGNVTFGPITFSNGPNVGLFLVKYTRLGALQWAAQGNGAGHFHGSSIAVDPGGNCYITGSFTGTVNFGGQMITSEGGYDIFIAKYNANGILQWVKREGNPEDDLGAGIAVDSVGNIYVAGTFEGTLLVGEYDLISAGLTDVLVMKYHSSGALEWAVRSGGTGADSASSISTGGGFGRPHVIGSFTGSAIFNEFTLTSAGTEPDIFAAQYDQTLGSVRWATRLGGDSIEHAREIVTDRFGNSYITGSFRGTANFDLTPLTSAGEGDIFITKLDGVGFVRWAVRAGGEGDESGEAIVVDGVGATHVTGRYNGTASFSGTNLTSAGDHDIFVAKYDGTGQFQWARSGGGVYPDVGLGIDIDADGEMYVAGIYDTTTTLGTITLNGTGATDLFIARLGRPSTIQTGPIAGSPFCGGAPVVVSFTVTGIFGPTNIFTVQLSDSSGSFASPTPLGTLAGVTGGSINTSIPVNVPTGSRYRIRVVSSSPEVMGADNGTDLLIYGNVIPTVTPASPVNLCDGGSVTLDAGPGYTSYQWSTGAVTRTVRVSQAGIYTVTVSNEAGCVGTSAPVTVSLLSAPDQPTISRVAQFLEASQADIYQWFLDGDSLPGETQRRLLPPRPGIYTVRVTNIAGCSRLSEPFILAASVPAEGDARALSIYPHPNRGIFTVDLTLDRPSMVRLSVLNALGEQVWQQEELNGEGIYRRQVNLGNVPPGIYFVRIESANQQWIREIIKQ